jgi:hypothetical protein
MMASSCLQQAPSHFFKLRFRALKTLLDLARLLEEQVSHDEMMKITLELVHFNLHSVKRNDDMAKIAFHNEQHRRCAGHSCHLG